MRVAVSWWIGECRNSWFCGWFLGSSRKNLRLCVVPFYLLIFLVFSRLSSKSERAFPSFWSSSVFCSCCILSCICWIFVISVASRVSRTMDVVAFVGSSPSLTTITFFWHFAHQRVPFLRRKSGDAHAGHARSVSVAPCLRRSAMRLMCWFSGFCFGKF